MVTCAVSGSEDRNGAVSGAAARSRFGEPRKSSSNQSSSGESPESNAE